MTSSSLQFESSPAVTQPHHKRPSLSLDLEKATAVALAALSTSQTQGSDLKNLQSSLSPPPPKLPPSLLTPPSFVTPRHSSGNQTFKTP